MYDEGDLFIAGLVAGVLISIIVVLFVGLVTSATDEEIMCDALSERGNKVLYVESNETCYMETEDNGLIPFPIVPEEE